MIQRSRHGWLPALRTLLLLAFALSLALQPVFGAMGELHESTAHAASAGLHADFAAPHDGEQAGDSDSGSDNDALHLLLHYAHCCGHAVGLVRAFEPPSMALPAAVQMPLVSLLAPAFSANVPFRPPIAA
ncbi:hypothetical protein [Vulcaniibacterium gelatinicum]|uniref:hypothetical protein n=1 Tax=Vulcaniibacterium gelatinicum TaxID=2598725 RepID=UPI0011C73AEF|nr:hypothetical protein [Vulcaniibacterium gelatinicum]